MKSKSWHRCMSFIGCLAMVTSVLLSPSRVAAEDSTDAAKEKNNSIDRKVLIGTNVDSFELTDFHGRTYSSNEFAKAPAVVLVFLGTQCPLAKFYATRVSELEAQYKDAGVAFIAVDPNVQDSLEMMASFARRHNLEMPFLKDPAQQLTDAVGVTRTPEAVLLDAQRKIVYRGRIDDQWGIGYLRESADSTELKNAIDAVLAAKPVDIPEVAAPGCLIGRRRASSTSNGDVTYANQISRIVANRCLQCHREGEIGPTDFSKYEDVAAWSDMMLEVIQNRRMPPWHADPTHGIHYENDRSLSQEEIDLFERWVDGGVPLGDVSQMPEPPKFVSGWTSLPREPDFVVAMSEEPVQVPAEGVIPYKHFTVKLPFTEDKWIKALQIKPGNAAVVHHVLIFDRPSGTRGGIMPHRSFLAGFVPGTRTAPFPDGMAKRLPAGSELVFQIHYTAIGTEQTDQTLLGIVFEDDPNSLTHEIQCSSVVDPFIRIPPGENNYTSTADLPKPLPECEILSVNPHMHVRGKSFRMTALYPDGSKSVLVDVPSYDFNWQTEYRLTQSMKVPAGTQVLGEATFDNSEDNLNNPDPTDWVSFGDQTWDEMMIGYFHIAVPIDPATGLAKYSVLPRDSKDENADMQEFMGFLDKNKDGKVEKVELPEHVKPYFILLDSNRDQFLTIEEIQKLGKVRGFGDSSSDF